MLVRLEFQQIFLPKKHTGKLIDVLKALNNQYIKIAQKNIFSDALSRDRTMDNRYE